MTEKKFQNNKKFNTNQNNNKEKYPILFYDLENAEKYADEKAKGMKKKINDKWVGIIVEAVPEGYNLYFENDKNLFLNKIKDQKIRHWA